MGSDSGSGGTPTILKSDRLPRGIDFGVRGRRWNAPGRGRDDVAPWRPALGETDAHDGGDLNYTLPPDSFALVVTNTGRVGGTYLGQIQPGWLGQLARDASPGTSTSHRYRMHVWRHP